MMKRIKTEVLTFIYAVLAAWIAFALISSIGIAVDNADDAWMNHMENVGEKP